MLDTKLDNDKGAQMSNLFASEAEYNGFDLEKGFKMVGFAVDSLSAGQIPYLCVTNINRWLNDHFGVNFSLFYQENSIPCVQPRFARFHLKDTNVFDGVVIATSFATAKSIKDAARSKRYYYINDITFLEKSKDLDCVMKNDNIIKFTRSKDYTNLLLDKGYNINPAVIKDFDINEILEII